MRGLFRQFPNRQNNKERYAKYLTIIKIVCIFVITKRVKPPPILKRLKTKKMKVYKFTTQNDFTYCVVTDNAVEEQNLSECYDQHGQQHGSEYEGWEVSAFTFWDGSNFKSLVVKGVFDGDIEEVDADEAAPIIAAVKAAEENTPYFDGVDDEQKIDGWEIYRTRWAGDPFIARVR